VLGRGHAEAPSAWRHERAAASGTTKPGVIVRRRQGKSRKENEETRHEPYHSYGTADPRPTTGLGLGCLESRRPVEGHAGENEAGIFEAMQSDHDRHTGGFERRARVDPLNPELSQDEGALREKQVRYELHPSLVPSVRVGRGRGLERQRSHRLTSRRAFGHSGKGPAQPKSSRNLRVASLPASCWGARLSSACLISFSLLVPHPSSRSGVSSHHAAISSLVTSKWNWIPYALSPAGVSSTRLRISLARHLLGNQTSSYPVRVPRCLGQPRHQCSGLAVGPILEQHEHRAVDREMTDQLARHQEEQGRVEGMPATIRRPAGARLR
jgi:hypothetical protein